MANFYHKRGFRRSSVIALLLGALLSFSFNNVSAQVSLTNASPNAFIDFSNTTLSDAGSNPPSAFKGNGFEPNTTTAGRLNSNAWAVDGYSDGTLAFGGTAISPPANDHARGATAAAQTTGGIYAFTGTPHSAANPALMIQSATNDFTPGSITLRIQNNGSSPITQFEISYDLFVRNDQGRASSFNFSWSTNNSTYNTVSALDYTSIEASDVLGWVQVGTSPSRLTIIGSQNIAPGAFFYIRWTSNDVSGSGARDELGLDNINVKATYGAPCTPPSYSASSISFSNVLPGQMDVNFRRGNGAGGLLVVAVANATLSIPPVNGVVYAASNNFGYGDAIGNGYVVYNSNAVASGSPGAVGSFSLYSLNPSTTYNLYFFEFNVVSNPCYQLTPVLNTHVTPSLTQSAAGYFQSKVINGNWNNANTWEWSATGVAPWLSCEMRPTSAASGILIRPTHTVALTTNESGAKLTIDVGGVLSGVSTGGGYALNIADKTGDDIIVNGTLELFGNPPSLASGANAIINSGGRVLAKNNLGAAASDDFARLTTVKFFTNAVFEWNTFFGFETAGQTYFNPASNEVPVFRVSTNISVGAGTPTIINGVLDVMANLTWNSAGVKTFRNGITGTGTLNQAVGCGAFAITGTSAFGGYIISGSGPINLNALTGMQINGNANGNLGSNKTVNNGIFKIMSNGYLNTDIYTVLGTTDFQVLSNGILGIGSPVGITTGAAGNIQTSTRTMDIGGSYRYTGYGNQVTGNLLPATVGQLQLQPATSGITVSLSQPLTISNNLALAYSTPIITHGILNINGTDLIINSSISNAGNAGSLTGNSTSNLTMGGTASQILIFSPASSLGLLTLNKPSGTATINNTQGGLSIFEGIYFNPSHGGGINFNNQPITLKSGYSHTAYFSTMYGAITNANRFTVERYIPAGVDHSKSWQLLAVPLNTTQTINQAWQDTATSANQNRYSGFGIQIASDVPDGSYSLGFDALANIGATVKTYNSVTDKWDDINNTKSTAITNKKGYMVMVRGDRSVITYNAPANATVVRATGSLYYGTAGQMAPASAITAGQFESVANPYACTIDFDLLSLNGGADKTFYVWDPLLTGYYGLGGFQTISGALGYLPTPGGTSNYPTGVPVSTIQSGQAVLMHATGSNGGVVFSEGTKVTSSNNVFRTPLHVSLLQAQLFRQDGTLADGNYTGFGNSFSNQYNGQDAIKIPHSTENFDIAAHSKRLSVMTRRPVHRGDTLFYHFANLTPQTYTIQFNPINFEGQEEAWLMDRFSGAIVKISRTETTRYTMQVSTIPASKQPGRLYIVFGKIKQPKHDVIPGISVFPNPIFTTRLGVKLNQVPAGPYKVALFQLNGNKIWEQDIYISSGESKISTMLPYKPVPGLYFIQVYNRLQSWRERVVVQ